MSAIAPANASAQRIGVEASAGAIADMYEDHNAVRIMYVYSRDHSFGIGFLRDHSFGIVPKVESRSKI